MKISSAALLAVVTANSAGERKFTNDPDWMSADVEDWWSNHLPGDRYKWINNRINRFFANHYDNKAMRLKNILKDTWGDAKSALEKCNSEAHDSMGLRKRRAVEDEGDFMEESDERTVEGEDFFADQRGLINNMARWIKYEIYDLGDKCDYPGLRLLTRMDRMNAYTKWKYCKTFAPEDETRCQNVLYRENGNLRRHPRRNPWHLSEFAKPIKE